MAGDSRFLITNGSVMLPFHDTPHVSTFLQSHYGAYTTTRTHNGGKSLLLLERHLRRLTDSARILFGASDLKNVSRLAKESISTIVPIARREWKPVDNEELAITTLLTDDAEGFGVHVHVSAHVPHIFDAGSGARLALVGPGRSLAEAKHTEWVRKRKLLENFRPKSVTELLLSNDGDNILEGSITNFFVVSRKDSRGKYNGQEDFQVEVLTSPIRDGVLPGVIRQLIIEVCLTEGITVREVSPSWSQRECWQEAFVTNSLRILEHVENIQAPNCLYDLMRKSPNDISWVEKQFGVNPGPITKLIQERVMLKAVLESFYL